MFRERVETERMVGEEMQAQRETGSMERGAHRAQAFSPFPGIERKSLRQRHKEGGG